MLRDLVRHTEKGLDILSQRKAWTDDANTTAGIPSSNANEKLRNGLKDEVETLSRALHIMTVVPKMANDMMMVGRLQGFDVTNHLSYYNGRVTDFNKQNKQLWLVMPTGEDYSAG